MYYFKAVCPSWNIAAKSYLSFLIPQLLFSQQQDDESDGSLSCFFSLRENKVKTGLCPSPVFGSNILRWGQDVPNSSLVPRQQAKSDPSLHLGHFCPKLAEALLFLTGVSHRSNSSSDHVNNRSSSLPQ
ncbi:hypothetical protein FEM48_Zijuj07G0117100 [Ziziphus jujuba var. spinosa]|uniref:Uncharacterized protein n=1 Tax=Ziziphus jujuba var. spinosa TaxID=714518 RepID=A0A978V4F5_ZIZJJ|nr:hypothetical protein FEM48_Zijuj07G0117100 [Ziziphus jujuba var. spinosa]